MTAHDSRTFDIFDQQGEALVIELRRLQRALAARLDEEVWVEAAPSVVQHDGGEEESRSVFGRYFRVIGDAFARRPAWLRGGQQEDDTVVADGFESHRSMPGPAPVVLETPAFATPQSKGVPAVATDFNLGRLRDWGSRAAHAAAIGIDFILARGAYGPALRAGNADWSEHLGGVFEAQLRTALRVLLIAGGVGFGWGAFVPLSGAVILPAHLVVQSQVKDVQHPTGGVVSSIAVHDGEHVKAGDVLLRLDRTQVEANYKMFATQFGEAEMQVARLTAERDGGAIRIPLDLAADKGANAVRIIAAEQALFDAREKALTGQKNLLQNNVEQFNRQLAGLQAQIESKSFQSALVDKELDGVQQLYDKGLVPLTRLDALKREKATLLGDGGQLQASVAETKTKIDQALLQSLRIDQDFRAQVTKDLTDAQARMSQVSEKVVAVRDQLSRLDLRAPTDGIVHDLSIHTVGGVIRPSEVVMKILPDADQLVVEGRLPPKDIDQVKLGQTASLRFSALDHQTTPELTGTVNYVSPDVTADKSNASFYTIRITIPDAQRKRLGGAPLTSGMPVEALLQRRNRTMLSYLAKPLVDQFHRMFKER
jgi:HlyD family secretion protein